MERDYFIEVEGTPGGRIPAEVEGYLRLWVAKFELHKRDFQTAVGPYTPLPENPTQRQLKAASPRALAEHWIFISKATSVGSLPWVCDMIGLDITCLKRSVLPNWTSVYTSHQPTKKEENYVTSMCSI